MMGRRRLLESVLTAADLDTELQPRLPVVEIAGNQRVLIENHRSVISYTTQDVLIKVNYGSICVRGRMLRLAKLGKEQLVITGQIDCVTLCKEGCGEN